MWATGAVGTCDWVQILFAYGYQLLGFVIILNIWYFWKDVKQETIEFLTVCQKSLKQESRNEIYVFYQETENDWQKLLSYVSPSRNDTNGSTVTQEEDDESGEQLLKEPGVVKIYSDKNRETSKL